MIAFMFGILLGIFTTKFIYEKKKEKKEEKENIVDEDSYKDFFRN